jgi:phage tail-like protein
MPTYLHQVVVRLEGNVAQTILLGDAVVTVGRGPESGLTLAHPLVSRNHAELRLAPEGLVLTDLGSSNGTFINGARLLAHQPIVLANGTTFEMPPFVLTYQITVIEDAVLPGEAPSVPIAQEVPVEPAPPPAPIVELPALPPAPPPPPREYFPATLAPGPMSFYLHDLPIIFGDDDFLGRFLLIMETIWEPLEQREDHIEMYFDPRTCPRSFLPYLASWLGLSFDQHWPESRIRDLVANGFDLYSWRATKYGLTRMIEVSTGVTPVITEPADNPYLFNISVHLPPESQVDREMLEHLILQHKPAHVGYVLDVRG